MNKYNTKLGQLLSLINRYQFYAHLKTTQSDKYCKGFSTWQQPVTMYYAQIANPHGLEQPHRSLLMQALLADIIVEPTCKEILWSVSERGLNPDLDCFNCIGHL